MRLECGGHLKKGNKQFQEGGSDLPCERAEKCCED
jgi:hypothetical protein